MSEIDEANFSDYFEDENKISNKQNLFSIYNDDTLKAQDIAGMNGLAQAQTEIKKDKPNKGISNAITRPSENKVGNRCSRGRKHKNSKEKRKHDRTKKDNIIRKIKVSLMKYRIENLNERIVNKNYQLLYINPSISENITRSFNRRLFQRRYRQIFYTTNISFNYKSTKKTLQTNRKVINYIYEYNEIEKEAYKILKKKYLDKRLFRDFAKYYKKELKTNIKNKFSKSEEEGKDEIDYCKKVVPYLKIGNFMGFFTEEEEKKATK